jgi:hypothetical protein
MVKNNLNVDLEKEDLKLLLGKMVRNIRSFTVNEGISFQKNGKKCFRINNILYEIINFYYI